jgi:hypothetical protein
MLILWLVPIALIVGLVAYLRGGRIAAWVNSKRDGTGLFQLENQMARVRYKQEHGDDSDQGGEP